MSTSQNHKEATGTRRVGRAPKPTPKKAWTPQFSARSPRKGFTVDSRPALCDMQLPGPRREEEGRGGATSAATALRLMIRSPLLAVTVTAVPAAAGGRPSAAPDMFWFFYLQAVRYFTSAEKADQEIRGARSMIREELCFEHGILLPDAKPNGDVPGADDFRGWRRRRILKPEGVLDAVTAQLTHVSLPLALAIRRAEDTGEPRPLHQPAVWDLIAVDGTVMNAPSDVRQIDRVEADGTVTSYIEGSRAKKPRDARIHHHVNEKIDKPHGAVTGLYNIAAVTKGQGTYTRVVLAVEIGQAGQGEGPVAMRMLHDMYDRIGRAFPVLLYDGAMVPLYQQDLVAEHGIYCVNSNKERNKAKKGKDGTRKPEPKVVQGPNCPLTPLGKGQKRYGEKRGDSKRTYVTAPESVLHEADGYQHEHHLAADDGAVYELNRPAHSGGDVNKTGLLTPVDLERLQDSSGEYYLRLTVAGTCAHAGEFTVSYDLRKTSLNRDGHLPWRSVIANIRVLPDALVELFAEVYGQRNQVEGYFSWLEACFYRKDRHASWGRDAQLFDLVGASLWHNTLTWAHLAYRHPEQDQQLRIELRDLPAAPAPSRYAGSVEHAPQDAANPAA